MVIWLSYLTNVKGKWQGEMLMNLSTLLICVNIIMATSQTDEYIKLFNEKNDFLLGPRSSYSFQEIYLEDFLKYVFARDSHDTEPFEETMSAEYRAWLNKKQEWVVKMHQWQKVHDESEPFEEKINYDDLPFFRYNPIAIEFTDKRNKYGNREQIHTIIFKEDQSCLDRIEGKDFVIASPITYVGRNRTGKNARYLYAFTVDLDGVGMKQLEDVIWQMQPHKMSDGKTTQHSPVANIIVNSGHGLHLYYLLEKPVPLFQSNIELLNNLKKSITNIVWNAYTSSLKERQYQGVLQGFRLPGTKTKFGETIRAFYNEDSELYSLKQLNDFTRHEMTGKATLTDKEVTELEKGRYNPNGVTLKEAERRWPEWYERVIVNGNKTPKKWHIKKDLYDWWLRRLRDDSENIIQGHRYFCMMALATYAVKCDIPEEELKRDAFSLVERMDSLTKDEDNHFSEDDVRDALQAYRIGYCTFPKNSIEYLTGLSMPEGNRRNGRTQEAHLKRARLLCDMDHPDGSWRIGNGRKKESYVNSKKAWTIAAWRYEHPTSHNKTACAKDTKSDVRTVRKWWNGVEELYNITGGAHIHWTSGVTPEKVGGLFKEFLLPDYDMTVREGDGLEMVFRVGTEDKGWYDPELADTWNEDVLRNDEK